MTNYASKLFLRIAPFIFIGLYTFMIISAAGSTIITHEDNSFNIIRKGTVTAPSDSIINSISEDGPYCFVSQSDSTVQICSYPAPRPNNKNAEILQGFLPAGEWMVKGVGVYIDSNTPLLHNNNNLGGFIGITVMFTIICGMGTLIAFSQNKRRPTTS